MSTAGQDSCRCCSRRLPWNRNSCSRCAIPLPGAFVPGRSCPACTARPPPHDLAVAAFRYSAPIAHSIVQLKFHGHLQSAPLLAGLLARTLAARPTPLPELLLPVPLHEKRLRWRGYNQALEIARPLALTLSIKLAPAAARRIRPTAEQTQLPAKQRRRNVRGAFAVAADVRGRRVALLDDVITTGATVAELSRSVRAAGAVRVEVWAVARA